MSTLSTALDSLIAKMGTLFPQHTRLPNPYQPEQNAEPFLAQGYGIMLGSAQENRAAQSSVGVKRRISVIQTRSFIALDSDPSTKESTEKTLIDDQMTLLKDLEVDFTLGGIVHSMTYSSDSGIAAVYANQKQFLKIETQFSMTYIESLT